MDTTSGSVPLGTLGKEVMATMAIAHLLDRPVPGSVTQSGVPASPRPLNAGHMTFSALATAPSRAREYTGLFLDLCSLPPETIEGAELVVSELTTNAFAATGGHAETRPISAEQAGTAVISLSLRHFSHGLLIEVIDSSPEPPVLAKPDLETEHGRGLWIVAALSREWGYFPVRNGKCVYSMLSITG
jgi:anti-sigma regulatory factor (Ser/Thr protein kinase)